MAQPARRKKGLGWIKEEEFLFPKDYQLTFKLFLFPNYLSFGWLVGWFGGPLSPWVLILWNRNFNPVSILQLPITCFLPCRVFEWLPQSFLPPLKGNPSVYQLMLNAGVRAGSVGSLDCALFPHTYSSALFSVHVPAPYFQVVCISEVRKDAFSLCFGEAGCHTEKLSAIAGPSWSIVTERGPSGALLFSGMKRRIEFSLRSADKLSR